MKPSRLALGWLGCLPLFWIVGCSAPPPVDEEGEVDGPEPTGEREDAAAPGTVANAVATSCATSSIKGLSLQIIQEAACIEPDAFVKLPDLPNLEVNANVFAYLEAPAHERLVAALQANPSKTMVLSSMLRTVGQQYLLRQWSANGACGIGLAAKPGKSNHETGLALDTPSWSTFKTLLSGYGFKWFGSADKVHFDYVGKGAVSYIGLDVRAFQRLWNRNNPNDEISVDGDYGPQTESRLKKSPAKGFAVGPICDTGDTWDADQDQTEDDAMPADQLEDQDVHEHDHEEVEIDQTPIAT